MALKPWYKVVTPREDLREGRPLDASEFAVHLDQIRDGRAPLDYQDPRRFFERTYLTNNLIVLAAETVRRLSGIITETSAVFNMATQFGGGKTHALSVLYHLANSGPEADHLPGVRRILEKAGVATIPRAAVAVFVGTEFDSITGRGGEDGTPMRKTPWGEIAFQLGGADAFAELAEHDRREIAPAGDVIRKILPEKTPCLILMDELMNHVSRNRKSGLASQFYDFLQNLSETVRGMKNVVLAVSIPASELEMTAGDQSDYDRFKKMLDRIGKAIFMSVESETAEIIRRRLFEWGGLPDEARKVCAEYADWIIDNRKQLPDWFGADPREAFLATYPFHPSVLSVFERKWQVLPRFQQTRGILRLLALWVSLAYQDGFKGAHRDHLIGLGTAPLDDALFQAAVFEQLGESKLIGAVTTDICGKKNAHALRLDKEAVEAIKKARLHRKVATSIFFESNGGMANAEATVPEIRLAVSDPEQDIANVETVLDNLTSTCYFLSSERNRYRFGIKPNLIKLLADRRANIKDDQIHKRVREQVQKVFGEGNGVERVYFPAKSNAVADRAFLTVAVLDPENSLQDSKTLSFIDDMTRSYGTSARTFKNAIIWSIADSDTVMKEEARKLLAWEEIKQDKESLRLDENQLKELEANLHHARSDFKESVWRSYKNLALLGKDNKIRLVDMGLINSSSATFIIQLILNRLMQDSDVTDGISAALLVRNWPPAFTEWNIRSVRDMFYASPQLPRLLNPNLIKDGIAKGVANKVIAYVGKSADGEYKPFYYGEVLAASDIEISQDMYIIKAEEAEKHKEPPALTTLKISPNQVKMRSGDKQTFVAEGYDQLGRSFEVNDLVWTATGGNVDEQGVYTAGDDQGAFVVKVSADKVHSNANVSITIPGGTEPPDLPPVKPPVGADRFSSMHWSGDLPALKWMNFYSKVLARFAASQGLKINVSIRVEPDAGVSEQNIEETKNALRELGLDDDIDLG